MYLLMLHTFIVSAATLLVYHVSWFVIDAICAAVYDDVD